LLFLLPLLHTAQLPSPSSLHSLGLTEKGNEKGERAETVIPNIPLPPSWHSLPYLCLQPQLHPLSL
jgi:hypothetical protein